MCMIVIGKTRIVPVRTRSKDGKITIKTGPDGQPETKLVSSDVWRECKDELDGQHGRDSGRVLVVGLVATDQLILYPKGTRQEIRVNLKDVYAWALRSRAQRAVLERARERKDRLATLRLSRRVTAAGRRMRAAARANR